MSPQEFVYRLWHRLRWGHPYYTTRYSAAFDRHAPCVRCTPPATEEPSE